MVRERIDHHDRFAHETGVRHVDHARDACRDGIRDDLRSRRRLDEDRRLIGAAVEFELAVAASIAAHHVGVVALLVWLDVPIATNIGHGGIEAKRE